MHITRCNQRLMVQKYVYNLFFQGKFGQMEKNIKEKYKNRFIITSFFVISLRRNLFRIIHIFQYNRLQYKKNQQSVCSITLCPLPLAYCKCVNWANQTIIAIMLDHVRGPYVFNSNWELPSNRQHACHDLQRTIKQMFGFCINIKFTSYLPFRSREVEENVAIFKIKSNVTVLSSADILKYINVTLKNTENALTYFINRMFNALTYLPLLSTYIHAKYPQ